MITQISMNGFSKREPNSLAITLRYHETSSDKLITTTFLISTNLNASHVYEAWLVLCSWHNTTIKVIFIMCKDRF